MKSKSVRRKNRRIAAKTPREPQVAPQDDHWIAAIGASAGGIEAYTELMTSLPDDTGMAFVLVQHLDPTHHSFLTELLSKKTAMRVKEVTDGMNVEPNHVYVIPPNTTMSISNHTLHLSPREELRTVHMSIDHFMRALAQESGHRAIGVILSGSGTDGTLGMAEIRAHGGVTFAQDESSAKYDSMPRSAVAAGCVDYILAPAGIARELARIARHPCVAREHPSDASGFAPGEKTGLTAIFQLLRRTTGVDFEHYRRTTILRRVQRRMVVHKIDKLEEYVSYVQTNSSEIKALCQDMLINVTSFFRDASVFDTLQSRVFPYLLKNRPSQASIRVWTPGCSSGEETYSVAIALLELLGDKTSDVPIQLFGTDASEPSVAKARSGFYPQNIQSDVSPQRLQRFFTKVESGYRVSKSIRDLCIFAQHNVLSDPPFSQMDLICCRNLLIYLEPVLQNKVISLFHYAARPGGYLVLGTSEGVGTATNLFSAEDRAHKVFLRKTTPGRQPVIFSMTHPGGRHLDGAFRIPAQQPDSSWNYVEAQKEFDHRLLNEYAPATAFLNEDMEIIHTRGSVNRYLKLAPGRASLSILKMAREGLLFDLRNAISRAKKENAIVRKQNVQIRDGNGHDGAPRPNAIRSVNFEVVPFNIGDLKELYFMIMFQDAPGETPRLPAARRTQSERESDPISGRIAKLQQELAANKEYLQSVIETQEATNEELHSANEEILSSNEELQSTNEELETAKEELQSVNEELSTVNDELRNRNVEVAQINTDLTNLLSSIDIAVIMVGSDLTIRRFTPKAQKFLGLIPADIGRPLLNINPTIEISDLHSLVLQVMATFQTFEEELTDRKGIHYQMKVLPYRTLGNRVDGVVITIVDITPEASADHREKESNPPGC